MLAGIGGRTIAEAKNRLSWNEYMAWRKYMRKHGPLSLQRRVEDAAALHAHSIYATIPRERGSKPLTLQDFKLYRQPDDSPIDLETAMETWR